MVRCPTRFELNELARGQVQEDRAERLLAHLDECARCGAWYDSASQDGLEDELRRAAGDAPDAGTAPDVVGGSLGRYRVLGRLGAGGMGIVYEAEQSSPRRRVALKVLQPLAATPTGLRRFELEGEVLSRLDHPSIAHVYEVGTFESPYGPLSFLAMELVHGRPPLEHARARGLTARARVELFLGICAGVAHAHARGVLHRDLKPSNVLVTADGVPKLLDFGVARVLDGRGDATVTRAGQVVGTLAYMSPEQLAAGEDAVDVRSDVYSLGVVLHELLSERLPVDLSGVPLAEAVRRLAAGSTGRTLAEVPGVDADLAAVVARSLEREPARRYRSVDALAEDLRRWLAREPVEARPCSWSRRAAMLVRRHRRAAAGLGAAAALVAVGVVGTTTQLLRARAAERAALEEARTAAAVGRFLDEVLSGGDPFLSGANPARSVRDLLEETARRLAEPGELTPETRADLLGTIGRAAMNLGDYERAREHLEQRHALLTRGGPERTPAAVAAALDLARLDQVRRRSASALGALEALEPRLFDENRRAFLELRGRAHLGLRRFADARADLEATRDLLERSPVGTEVERAVLDRLLAVVDAGEGDAAGALARSTRALHALERTLGPDNPVTAIARRDVALLLGRAGRHEEAEAQFARADRAFEEVLGERNLHGAYVVSDWADLRAARGDREGAIALYRRALAALPTVDPRLHAYRRARVCVRLALLLEETGETEELLAEASRLMGLQVTGQFDSDHPTVRLAKALAREGRHAEVVALYRDLLERLGPEEAGTERTLSLYNNLAVALVHEDELDEAEAVLRDTLRVRHELLGPDHVRTATAATNLACTLLLQGRAEEAAALLDDSYAICADELGPEHARTVRTRRHRAEALLGAGRLEEALAESEAALALAGTAYPDQSVPQVGDTWLLRGECLLAAGERAAAREHLLRARAILEARDPLDERLLARTSRALAACERP